MPKSGKMDLLAQLLGEGGGITGRKGKVTAAGQVAKAGKSGLLGSAAAEGAPDFSGLLSGLMKSQLGTGKSQGQPAQGDGPLGKAASSSGKPEGKKSDRTRESKATEATEGVTAAQDVAARRANSDLLASNLPGAMWALARAAKPTDLTPSTEKQAAPAQADSAGAEVKAKGQDPRRALMGGDLALALATLAKAGRSETEEKPAAKSKNADKREGGEAQDLSTLFEKPTTGSRSGAHGTLDKSQAELTHASKEPLSALSSRKESDSGSSSEAELKTKAKALAAREAESFRMELPSPTETKSSVSDTKVYSDVRAEVLAPDPTAGDLNIRGSVQGQSARLVVDAGQGIGELEFHLRVRQGVASVRIEGESAAAMAGRTDELRRSVESQGLSLGTVEISRPAADAPISNTANMMQARTDRGDHSGGNARERMETRLEEGTARGQPATLASQPISSRSGTPGSVDVQA